MERVELVAKQLTAAMAALEAALALLDVGAPVADPSTCQHEHKTYLAMGQWTCDDCNQQGND